MYTKPNERGGVARRALFIDEVGWSMVKNNEEEKYRDSQMKINICVQRVKKI